MKLAEVKAAILSTYSEATQNQVDTLIQSDIDTIIQNFTDKDDDVIYECYTLAVENLECILEHAKNILKDNENALLSIEDGMYTILENRIEIPTSVMRGDIEDRWIGANNNSLYQGETTRTATVYFPKEAIVHAIVPDKDGMDSLEANEYDLVINFPENGKHPDSVKRFVRSVKNKYKTFKVLIETYSPFIVQCADKVFNHKGNEVEDMQQWRVDQILQTDLFGEVGVRSSRTEADVKRRRLLIEKRTLTHSEEEELKILEKRIGNVFGISSPKHILMQQELQVKIDAVTKLLNTTK